MTPWIPVSQALPEEGIDEEGHCEDAWVQLDAVREGRWDLAGVSIYIRPVAWMTLPELYKESN